MSNPIDPQHPDIRPNDIRIVNLNVKCMFTWSETLIADYDERMNPIYYSGWVMEVMPGQKFYPLEGQKIESKLFASTSSL